MALAHFRAPVVWLIVTAAAPGAGASTADDVAGLVSDRTTNERRDALVATLSAAPFREVAPRIVPLLREYATPAEPGMGPKPWLEDGHSVRARIWYALGAVWQSQIAGEPDPAKAHTLHSMLGASGHPRDRCELIQAIGHHWTEASERPLAALVERRSEAAEVRVAAASELLRRAPIDRYVPAAVALVRELAPSERSAAYRDLANLGNAVRAARADSRASLVDLGFELLEADENPDGRYFLARAVGFLLDAPGEFAPDVRDPQYQSPNGLTPAFFEQTVRNARTWRAAHPPEAPIR
ncbi:MAG: hypothetical protein ABW221_27820 [Vicinamibacteria bacterium]